MLTSVEDVQRDYWCLACSALGTEASMYPLRPSRKYAKIWLIYSGRLDLLHEVTNYSLGEYDTFRKKTRLCRLHFSHIQFTPEKKMFLDSFPDVIETMPAPDLKSVQLYKKVLLETSLVTRLQKLDALVKNYSGLTVDMLRGNVRTFVGSTSQEGILFLDSGFPISQDCPEDVVIGDPVPNFGKVQIISVTERHQGMDAPQNLPSGKTYLNSEFRESTLPGLDDQNMAKDKESGQVSLKNTLILFMKPVLAEAIENMEYSDVTVLCKRQKFAAHKLVLSACSSFLRDLFLDLPTEENAVLVLDNYDEVDVANALIFLYNGTILVNTFEDLAGLKKVLDDLQVKPPTADATFQESSGISTHFGGDEAKSSDNQKKSEAKLQPNPQPLSVGFTLSNLTRIIEENCEVRKQENRKEHKKLVNKEPKQLLCQLCSFKAKSLSSLTNHSRQKHNNICLYKVCYKPANYLEEKKKRRICEKCGEGVLPEEVEEHECLRLPTACLICKKPVESEKSSEHSAQHSLYKNGERAFSCNYCKMSFLSYEELREHRLSDVETHTRKCPVCNKLMFKGQGRHSEDFGFRAHLRMHAHDELKQSWLKCPKCSKTFNKNKYLRNHYASHFLPNWQQFECGKCFWGFESLKNLNLHLKICSVLDTSQFLPLATDNPFELFTSPIQENYLPASPKGQKVTYNGKKDQSNLNSFTVEDSAATDNPFELTSPIRENYLPTSPKRQKVTYKGKKGQTELNSLKRDSTIEGNSATTETPFEFFNCPVQENHSEPTSPKTYKGEQDQTGLNSFERHSTLEVSAEKSVNLDTENDGEGDFDFSKMLMESFDEEVWKCSNCSAVFITQADYVEHVHSMH